MCLKSFNHLTRLGDKNLGTFRHVLRTLPGFGDADLEWSATWVEVVQEESLSHVVVLQVQYPPVPDHDHCLAIASVDQQLVVSFKIAVAMRILVPGS